MTHSVSIVFTYESPKERERSPNQHASRLHGALYRWLDHWTRLPHWLVVLFSNQIICRALHVLMPCPVIEPSVEHSKKSSSMCADPGFFFIPLDFHTNTECIISACLHIIKASQALPLPRAMNNNFAWIKSCVENKEEEKSLGTRLAKWSLFSDPVINSSIILKLPATLTRNCGPHPFPVGRDERVRQSRLKICALCLTLAANCSGQEACCSFQHIGSVM